MVVCAGAEAGWYKEKPETGWRVFLPNAAMGSVSGFIGFGCVLSKNASSMGPNGRMGVREHSGA
jgi:hypothetical protein